MAEIAAQADAKGVTTRRTLLLLEFVAMMMCVYVPSVISYFMTSSRPESVFSELRGLEFVVGRLALVCFIVWVGDGSLKRIGLSKPSWKVDGLAAISLFAAMVALVGIALAVTGGHFGEGSSYVTHDLEATRWTGEVPIAVSIFVTVAALFEQAVFHQGYIIGTLGELLRNKWLGVLGYAVLYSLLAWPEGFSGAVLFALTAALGATFAITGRIWAGFAVLSATTSYDLITQYLRHHAG